MSASGVFRQLEMTPASCKPISWHAVTRDLNRYRVVSAMAMFVSYVATGNSTSSGFAFASSLVAAESIPD